MNISLESRHLEMVKEIIKIYPYNFFVFGSRAKNTSHKFSDLDLCIMEEVPGNILSQMEEDFQESDLPFKVDLIQWQKISEDFRKAIGENLIALPK